MGTPPSYLDSESTWPGVQPAARLEIAASSPAADAALRLRIADLERTRMVDAARIAALEVEVRALRAGR